MGQGLRAHWPPSQRCWGVSCEGVGLETPGHAWGPAVGSAQLRVETPSVEEVRWKSMGWLGVLDLSSIPSGTQAV